ncbi:MAG: hypothetical protein ACI8RW_000151 [Porticoccaceae bacterium]|jgi:hypothetical protein
MKMKKIGLLVLLVGFSNLSTAYEVSGSDWGRCDDGSVFSWSYNGKEYMANGPKGTYWKNSKHNAISYACGEN